VFDGPVCGVVGVGLVCWDWSHGNLDALIRGIKVSLQLDG
jgi:hypothetical protein